MTLETYLAIALLHMGQDALQTHEAKIPYRATASLVWSLIWPFTAALMIALVIYSQRRRNDAIQGTRSGSAGMEG
jgi:hypothetical protein